jgi:origin recognition complex subunit 3
LAEILLKKTGRPGKLQTLVLVSSPRKQHELHSFLEAGSQQPSDKSRGILIQLQPSHCPNLQTALKTVIKTAMTEYEGEQGYTNFLAEHKALIPMHFDLELLERYVRRHEVPVVQLCMLDVEAFDSTIVSELLSTFHSWSDRIPMVLFIGVTTTVELFEARFSRATISLLDATVISTRSSDASEDPLFGLYESIQYDPSAETFAGAAVLSVLAELAAEQGTTIETFTRALKYLYMTHFFANAVSSLSTESSDLAAWDETTCRTVRALPSFKNHCELLSNGDEPQRQTARQLLTSDETLETEAKSAITSGQQLMRESLKAIRTLRYFYHSLLNLDEYTPFETESSLLSSLPDLTNSNIFKAVRTANRSLPVPFSRETVFSNLDPVLSDFATFCREPDRSPASEDLIISLEKYLHARTSSPSSTSPFRRFLAESYTITSKQPLSQIIHPRARYVTERSLLHPADYLACDCCAAPSSEETDAEAKVDSASNKATLPPASLLFRMLSEAGATVNVRDLWDAFHEVKLNGPLDEALVHGKPTTDEDDEDEDLASAKERQSLSEFYTALAELRYLGLVKQVKRQAGAGRGSGAEYIQKTSWVGL